MSRCSRASWCALCAVLATAATSTAVAQMNQAGYRKQLNHQPVYDYRGAYGGQSSYGNQAASCNCDGQGLGYWGPVDCGANCGGRCSDCGSGGSGDCGCGGCEGGCSCGDTCGCGDGCNCQDYGSCGCSDCGGGCADCYIDGGMGCGSCDPCCDDCCMPCQPDCCLPAVTFFGDFLYLQSTNQDVAHAQQQDGIGGAGTVPFGDIGTIGTDFNPGFRVGGALKCGPCTQVLTSYTWYESDARSNLDPPSGTNTGAVGSLVHHPGAALTASAGPVDATYDLDFQLGDVMWRRVFLNQPRYQMGFSAGVEYGHLEQRFAQNGVFGGGLGGAIDTATSINFDGGGIKIGIDGDHSFSHGLGIYARATASALTGRFSSRYSMYNETTDQMLAAANWKDDRVIGRFEYEVGASCTSVCGHWRAAAGYMFSYWTNTVTTGEFIDAVQADNYTNIGDTLGFNGLVGRVECRW